MVDMFATRGKLVTRGLSLLANFSLLSFTCGQHCGNFFWQTNLFKDLTALT